eukprot:COSAG02_NODE_28765_length_583_cov_0.783058_2_plen_78_part_01
MVSLALGSGDPRLHAACVHHIISILTQYKFRFFPGQFFVADDLRYQLGTSGPGDVGPGCPITEGGGCTMDLPRGGYLD